MPLRQILGVGGIVLALAAVALESRAAWWLAVTVLGLSILVRLIQSVQARRRAVPPEDPAE